MRKATFEMREGIGSVDLVIALFRRQSVDRQATIVALDAQSVPRDGRNKYFKGNG